MTSFREHLLWVVRGFSGDVTVAEIKATFLRTLPEELIAVVEKIRAAAGERALDWRFRATLRHHRDDAPDGPDLFDAYPTGEKGKWRMREGMTIALWLSGLWQMDRDDAREAERRARKREAFKQWGREEFGQEGIAALEEFERRAGADR